MIGIIVVYVDKDLCVSLLWVSHFIRKLRDTLYVIWASNKLKSVVLQFNNFKYET